MEEQIIICYAHDYRDMKMREEEVEKMLRAFLKDIKNS